VQRLIKRSALGLFTALTLAVTACGSDNGGGGTGNNETEDPTLQLTSSVEALNEETFKIEMTMGDLLDGNGAVDAAGGAGQMSMTVGAEGQTLDMEIVFTESDMWMNLGELGAMIGAETPWMHVDLSRLGEEGFMGMKPGETDFAGTTQMLQALGEVEQVDDRTFQGEIDLTQADSAMIDEEMLGGTTMLPFTAILDEEGRLTQLEVDFPEMEGMPADNLVVRYFDFGQPVEITPPPAEEVSEMPAELYQMFEM
jgi:hypothetical protein